MDPIAQIAAVYLHRHWFGACSGSTAIHQAPAIGRSPRSSETIGGQLSRLLRRR
jgi:hypothetical protein